MSESEVELAGTGDVANCTLPERFDVADRVPDGLVHVDLPRLGPTCKRLGIEYSKAIVGWNEFRKRGERHRHPVTSGVVIREADHDRLLAALADKKEKERKKAEKLPVLAALFTLNRRAKRCRAKPQLCTARTRFGIHRFTRREQSNRTVEEQRVSTTAVRVVPEVRRRSTTEVGIRSRGDFHDISLEKPGLQRRIRAL